MLGHYYKQAFKNLLFRLVCCVFFCSFFSLSSFSQNLSWSDPQKRDSYNYMQIFGQDEEGFYVLKSNMPLNTTKQGSLFKKREYHVMYYTNDMHLRWEHTPEGWAKNIRTERVIFANFKPLAIFTEIDSEGKKFTLYAQWLGTGGAPEGTPLKLLSLTYQKKDDIESMEIITSRDQTKIAFVIPVKGADTDNQSFRTLVINDQLETLWDKEFHIDFQRKVLDLMSYNLSNMGILSLLASNKTDITDDSKQKPFHTVFIYNYKKDSLAQVNLKLNEKAPTDVSFSFDNINQKIILCGFYSTGTSYSAAGIYYASIDALNGKIQALSAEPFSADFLSRFPGERKLNNGKELLNYSIDKLVLRNDGGALITAEAFYTSSTSYYDVFTQSYMYRTNYHYNNVMVLSVNPDGTTDWNVVIPKQQTSTEDGGFYSSYCSLTYQDRIFYIYNDFSGRKNRVSMYTITNKGGSSKSDLLTESNESILVSKAAKQIDDNVILVPAEKSGNFCFLKITF